MAAAVVLSACAPAAVPAPAQVGTLALRDLAGRAVALAAADGRPTLVAFWATWCAPCRRELPLLDCVHRARGGTLRVLGVALDDDPRLVAEFAADRGVGFATLHDPRGAATRAVLPVDALPYAVVIDAGGRIVERLPGARDWTAWAGVPAATVASDARCVP